MAFPRWWRLLAAPVLWLSACGLGRYGTRPDGEGLAATVASTGASSTSGAGGATVCLDAASCGAPSCQDGVLTTWACQSGNCVATEAPCAPYACDAASDQCVTDCGGDDAKCAVTHTCDGAACVLKEGLGETCRGDDDCEDGLTCADGNCCAEACDGVCEACVQGACVPIAALADPAGECTGKPALGCDGSGMCAECGFNQPVAQLSDCPSPCDECELGTSKCIIRCKDGACKDKTVTCPPDRDCDLTCQGNTGCENATIACPDDHGCFVHCTGTAHSCKSAMIACPDHGTCAVTCENDECEGAAITCGRNACKVECVSSPDNKPPKIDGTLSCSVSQTCTPP